MSEGNEGRWIRQGEASGWLLASAKPLKRYIDLGVVVTRVVDQNLNWCWCDENTRTAIAKLKQAKTEGRSTKVVFEELKSSGWTPSIPTLPLPTAESSEVDLPPIHRLEVAGSPPEGRQGDPSAPSQGEPAGELPVAAPPVTGQPPNPPALLPGRAADPPPGNATSTPSSGGGPEGAPVAPLPQVDGGRSIPGGVAGRRGGGATGETPTYQVEQPPVDVLAGHPAMGETSTPSLEEAGRQGGGSTPPARILPNALTSVARVGVPSIAVELPDEQGNDIVRHLTAQEVREHVLALRTERSLVVKQHEDLLKRRYGEPRIFVWILLIAAGMAIALGVTTYIYSGRTEETAKDHRASLKTKDDLISVKEESLAAARTDAQGLRSALAEEKGRAAATETQLNAQLTATREENRRLVDKLAEAATRPTVILPSTVPTSQPSDPTP